MPELEQGVVVLLLQRARGKGQSLGQPVGGQGLSCCRAWQMGALVASAVWYSKRQWGDGSPMPEPEGTRSPGSQTCRGAILSVMWPSKLS